MLIASSAIVTSIHSANAQALISGETGEPTAVGVGRVLFPMTSEAYREAASARAGEKGFVPLGELPSGLSDAARFGFGLAFDEWERSWALDETVDGKLAFYGDFNANGDVADDEPIHLRHVGRSYVGQHIAIRVDTTAGIAVAFPLVIGIEVGEFSKPGSTERTFLASYRTRQLREGVLEVGSDTVRFALVGTGGRFDGPHDVIYIDTDRDGALDMASENDAAAPASSERFQRDGSIVFGSIEYGFDVDPYGRRLTLRPRTSAPSPGTGLGSAVPDIQVEDLEGRTVRLSSLRDQVVLLDFWGLWCAPCIAGVPQLIEAYERWSPRGLEIVSVNVGDDPEAVRRFARDHEMNWVHVREEHGGPLQHHFQVRAFPTFIVIGKDGTLLSNGLGVHDELVGQLEALLHD